MKNIFISYGHDDHAELAYQLKLDLESDGFTVWIDGKKIKPANYWELAIEKGIGNSEWVVVLMTPYSMRRPDGVCLDEISYARYQGKRIVPIMVQQVQPPLSIARIQWLDLQKYQHSELYQKGYNELSKVLNGEYILGFEGELTRTLETLSPLDDRVEIGRHMDTFIGRDWLFQKYKDWLEHQPESRVFWIKGPAGIGKSAFSAKLALESKNVVGVHFFKDNDSDKRDTKRAICSLAYYLASQLPEYMNLLLSHPEFRKHKIAEKNETALFNFLLVQPLNQITPPDERYIFVLDALDEAGNKSNFLRVIAQEFDKTPKWLGLVITSRPDADIIRRLAKFQPYELDAKDRNNLEDIERYLRKKLIENRIDYNDEDISQLIEKSEGIFLYITEIMKDLINGTRSLSNLAFFPVGLTGIYLDFFERQFPDIDVYEKNYRPLLELVMAAQGPLPIECAATILNWDFYQQNEILNGIGTLFHINNFSIEPFHKSIKDWITNPNLSGDFSVSERNGHNRLVEYSGQQYDKGVEKMSAYTVAHYYHHLLEIQAWEKLETLIMDNQFIAAKINVHQEMELLDFYQMVINHHDIDVTLAQRIDRHFKKQRLRILFGMKEFFV